MADLEQARDYGCRLILTHDTAKTFPIVSTIPGIVPYESSRNRLESKLKVAESQQINLDKDRHL
jgi:hypothetical protein